MPSQTNGSPRRNSIAEHHRKLSEELKAKDLLKKNFVGNTSWLKKEQLGNLFYKNDALKRLVREGIPDDMRSTLWLLWSGARFKVTDDDYFNDLLSYYEGQPSVATRDIDKVRSFEIERDSYFFLL